MKSALFGVAAVVLAACAPTVPDSGAKPAGVGFGDYDQYSAERQAALAGPQPQTVAPPAVTAQPLAGGAAIGTPAPNTGDLAADVSATLAATAQPGTAPAALAPDPMAMPMPMAAPAAQGAVIAAPGIAPGIDLGAAAPGVTAPAPVATNPNVVPVTPLPERTDTDRPNIVAYAIASKNPVGQQAYARTNPFREGASARACAKYASADRAQEEFLAAGGPERDGKSLDPDGDGFACSWDPTPFRTTGN